MTLVRTLLGLPELRLRLRAGGDLLDREVTRIYVTELPDPSRYVTRGELVLSGLLWWHAPGDAEPFVAALAEAGCAALAASGADSGGIPSDLVSTCERHRIPLVEVPADLSFAVITERVVLALAAESDGARKRLLSAAAETASLPELLASGAAELGADCWIRAATGRIVAGSTSSRPRDRAVVTVSGRHAVPWTLVVDTELSGGRAEIADELASLVGLARAREDEVRAVRTRVAEPLLALLRDRSAADPAELASAFAAAGLAQGTRLRVLAASTPAAPIAAEVLGELLADHPAPFFAGAGNDPGSALAVAADADWPSGWAADAQARTARLGPGRILVGTGGPAPLSGLRGAAEEALHAVGVAERGDARVAVVSGERLGPHTLLLAGAPDDLRRALRARVLGPLEQNPELLHTLRVFLECSGSPAKAAKALHVHVNTLRYRMARAGELLGVDVTDFRTQVDLYLALSIDP
ncbi:PucR family transcriptional regulator ligand-binding domain-containing protein [Saccharomonospora sp. NPDC006951]